MATLTTTGSLRLQATHVATAPSTDLAVSSGAQGYVEKIISLAMSDGTTAGKADRMFSDRRTVDASSSEDLDLAGGVTDFVGSTFSFVKIKLLLVTAATGNTNNVVIGDSASNPWAGLLGTDGTITLRPGDTFLYVANSAAATGCPVAAGSSDNLLVANSSSGTSVTYDIVVIGTSA